MKAMLYPMRKSLVFTSVFALCVGALSCGAALPDPGRSDRENTGVLSVRVTVTSGDRGDPLNPRPFTQDSAYTVDLAVLGVNGQPVSTFNGTLSLSVVPGVLTSITGPGVTGRVVRLTNGVASGVQLNFKRAYGETRIFAADEGYEPAADPTTAACSNGEDDDRDGRVDFPADYGCRAPNDNSERGGSYAQGASEPIFIGTPSIDDVQGPGATTPLLNERVTIDRGSLIVTRISVSGFWVTDTSRVFCAAPGGGQRRCANSLFSFNFRLPDNMRGCDRLRQLQGTVQEFVSTTQLAQPAWSIAPEGFYTERSMGCEIPDAVVLRPRMLNAMGMATEMPATRELEEVLDMSNVSNVLEPLENAMVRVQNVMLSQNVGPERVTCDMNMGTCNFDRGRSNCDITGDNVVDFNHPIENFCANLCQKTRDCSEWTGWVRFGQMAVDFVEHQPAGVQRFIVAPLFAISNFNPLNQPAPGVPAIVTGTLKQVGPNWIIEPRCTVDLLFASDPRFMAPPRARESCVTPRTVSEEGDG
jgi:hypothetical protein